MPNEDYFAQDFLLDEWMPLIPFTDNYLRLTTHYDSGSSSPKNTFKLNRAQSANPNNFKLQTTILKTDSRGLNPKLQKSIS